MEQFAVEQFPAEGLGKFPGDFAAARTVFAGDGDDVHVEILRAGAKNRPHQESLLAGPGYCPYLPYQKNILKVGVISVGTISRPSRFMGEPHRRLILLPPSLLSTCYPRPIAASASGPIQVDLPEMPKYNPEEDGDGVRLEMLSGLPGRADDDPYGQGSPLEVGGFC